MKFKTKSELNKMRKSGEILARVFDKLASKVTVGVSAAYIDQLAYDTIISFGAKPSFLGYSGYKYSTCISVNNEVVHGLPTEDKLFLPGDVCCVDMGVYFEGFHSDACRIFRIEQLDPKLSHLCDVTENSFYKAIEGIGPGNRLGDLCHSLQQYVEQHNLTVVRDLYSHGIGKQLHEDPIIPNYGKKGTGILLKPGFTFALEPMVNMGTHKVRTLDDDWTIVTEDGSCSAHYENTVAVTESGIEILTVLN